MTEQTPITELNFEETGPITLDAFLEEHKGISLTVQKVDSRPGDNEWVKGSRHFKCTLQYDGRQYTFYYTQGSGHTEQPTLEDCLSCLKTDAWTAINCEDAAVVMDEFGYENVKEARRIYKGCEQTRDGLKRLFPETFMILIEHTEDC